MMAPRTYGIHETPIVRALHLETIAGRIGEVFAVLVLGEFGFFAMDSDDSTKAEVARFFARCEPDCRDPVEAPQFAVHRMALWTGLDRRNSEGVMVPDWSANLRRWLWSGGWYDDNYPPPMSSLARRVLRMVFDRLAGHPMKIGDVVRALHAGWRDTFVRFGQVEGFAADLDQIRIITHFDGLERYVPAIDVQRWEPSQ